MIRTYKSLKWPKIMNDNDVKMLTKIVCSVWNCKNLNGRINNHIN